MPYRFPLPSVSYANPLESIPPSFTPVCVFPLCAQHNLFHPSCERISRLPFVTTYNRLREKRERRNIEWGAQVRRINLEIRMVRVLLFCVSTFAFTRIPEAINKLVRCWTRAASSRAHRENLTNCEKPLRHPFLSVQISFRVRYKPSLSLSLSNTDVSSIFVLIVRFLLFSLLVQTFIELLRGSNRLIYRWYGYGA